MPRFTTASAIRVDMETIKRRPGTCFNLEAVTTHYVQKGSLEPTKLSHALLGKVMAYGFGRVLKQQTILPLEATCNEMMDDAFGEEFIDDVDAIIKDIPKLRSTRDTLAMARKLIDLLINQPPSAPPTPQPAPPPEEQQQLQVCKSDQSEVCEQGSGDVPATQDVEGRQRVGGGSSSQEQDDQNAEGGAGQEQEGGDQEQEQGEDEQASGAGGNGAGSGGGKRPTPDEIAEMLKEKTGYGDLSALIQSELDDIADNTPSSIRSGIPMLPDVGRLKPQFGKLNEVEAISASSRMRAK